MPHCWKSHVTAHINITAMMMKNLGGAGGADPSAAGGAGGLASLLGKSFTLSF